MISEHRLHVGLLITWVALMWSMASVWWQVRFWRRLHRDKRDGPVYNRRRLAASWIPLLSMYVGLLAFDVGCYVLNGSWFTTAPSIVIISGCGYFAWRQRQKYLRLAQEAEDEEVSKVVIPDHLPRDL